MKPRHNRILVEPKLVTEVFADELMAAAGMYLSGSDKQGVPNLGQVVSIGTSLIDLDFGVDDLVFFDEPKPWGFDAYGKTLFSVKPSAVKAIASVV